MLTKRTNILFEEELWKTLVKLAQFKNTSVGELVRNAVSEKYTQKMDLEKRRQTVDWILKHRKIIKGRIDYKELINAGREF